MTEQPLFYIILLGLIVIVFGQIAYKKEKPVPQQPQQALEEFEQTVELFASDLEEQNEALAKLFKDTRREYELHLAKQTGKIETLEKQSQEMAREMTQLKRALGDSGISQAERPAAPVQSAARADKPPADGGEAAPISALLAAASESAAAQQLASAVPQQQEADTRAAAAPQLSATAAQAALPTLKDRYSELFELHNGGKSIEYIAKKLGKNKGEVSLILMLAKQEEAAR